MKIYARVAMEFDVDQDELLNSPDDAFRNALLAGRAYISDGDNYAPAPWNEDILEDDCTFSLGTHEFYLKDSHSSLDKWTTSTTASIEHCLASLQIEENAYLRKIDNLDRLIIQDSTEPGLVATYETQSRQMKTQLYSIIDQKMKFLAQLKTLRE